MTGRGDGKTVFLDSEIEHVGGPNISIDSNAYLELQQWMANGAQRDGSLLQRPQQMGTGDCRRDFAQVRADGTITLDVAHSALKLLEVDEYGFDEVDRKLLRAIIDKFGGGPVGVNSIAAAISEERDAIEDIYEPYLIQIGFLDRTPRGRVATPRAYEYFGLTAPGRDSRLW